MSDHDKTPTLRKSEAGKRSWADPKVRKRRTEAIRRARRSPEARARTSQASKKAWSDPERHARWAESIARAAATPETRKRTGEASRRSWSDPETRQRMIDAISEAKRTPQARHRASETIRAALANPEARQRMSERSKRTWADPKVRQSRTEGIRRGFENPEVRQRMSEGQKGSWTLERRQKQSVWTKKMWVERTAALRKAGLLPAKPMKRRGRPRSSDAIGVRLQELHDQQGKSWTQIERLMNKGKPDEAKLSKDAYRSHYRRYVKDLSKQCRISGA